MKKTIIAAAFVALVTPLASAQVIEADSEFGVGTVTRDVAQNLDFLDLTLSRSRSFTYVASQLGAGGDFGGWRHASGEEVVALLNNWGFEPTLTAPASDGWSFEQVSASGPQNDILSGLIDLLGVTNTTSSQRGLSAITADVLTASNAGNLGTVNMFTYRFDASQPDYVFFNNVSPSSDSLLRGHFLVRTVPAPSALALFAAAGLAASRRRRAV